MTLAVILGAVLGVSCWVHIGADAGGSYGVMLGVVPQVILGCCWG